MSIIDTTIRVYDSQDRLIQTIPVIGGSNGVITDVLSPGCEYYCSVESTNDEQISSGESPKFKFYSVPDVNFTGYVNRDSSGFTRNVEATQYCSVLEIIDTGIEYADNSNFYDAVRVSGNRVDGLSENTTYYYRPWVLDDLGRTYVNRSAVDSVTTLYAVPQIEWISIYGATVGTFSALIDITSSIELTNVVALVTNSGNTTTHQLSVQDGRQYITIVGLNDNTTYDIVIKATNAGGDGYSIATSFTTQMAGENEMFAEIIPRNIVSNVDNTLTIESVTNYNRGECTIVGHYVDVFENETHSGEPVFEYDGGDDDNVTAIIQNVAPDTTYWLNSRIEYTVGTNPTIYEIYSEPVQIQTYSLLKFTNIRVTYTTADIDFVVEGNSQNTTVEYSADGVNYNSIAISDPQGGTLELNWLQLNHTYYLRGRCESAAGVQEWVEDTFTTR